MDGKGIPASTMVIGFFPRGSLVKRVGWLLVHVSEDQVWEIRSNMGVHPE